MMKKIIFIIIVLLGFGAVLVMPRTIILSPERELQIINASCSTSVSIGIFSEGYEDVWFHDGEGLNNDIVAVHPVKSQSLK